MNLVSHRSRYPSDHISSVFKITHHSVTIEWAKIVQVLVHKERTAKCTLTSEYSVVPFMRIIDNGSRKKSETEATRERTSPRTSTQLRLPVFKGVALLTAGASHCGQRPWTPGASYFDFP